MLIFIPVLIFVALVIVMAGVKIVPASSGPLSVSAATP